LPEDAWAFRNEKFEKLAEDHMDILVDDGTIQMKNMKITRLTIERLFSQLRGSSIRHLGEVKRLHF